jgi:hypothetical protein
MIFSAILDQWIKITETKSQQKSKAGSACFLCMISLKEYKKTRGYATN